MVFTVCRQCLANPSFKLVFHSSFRRPLSLASFSRISSSRHASPRLRAAPADVHATQARRYQHLAKQQESATGTPPQTPQPSLAQAPPKQDLGGEAVHISLAEQRRRDWSIIRKLVGNLWPKDDYKTRARVVLGFGLLVGGKVRAHNSVRRWQWVRHMFCRS